MGIVNAKLLADNLARFNNLSEDFSAETIASASRDRTGVDINATEVEAFLKIGNLASKKMLISAKQEKRLKTFAKEKTAQAMSSIQTIKEEAIG